MSLTLIEIFLFYLFYFILGQTTTGQVLECNLPILVAVRYIMRKW